MTGIYAGVPFPVLPHLLPAISRPPHYLHRRPVTRTHPDSATTCYLHCYSIPIYAVRGHLRFFWPVEAGCGWHVTDMQWLPIPVGQPTCHAVTGAAWTRSILQYDLLSFGSAMDRPHCRFFATARLHSTGGPQYSLRPIPIPHMPDLPNASYHQPWLIGSLHYRCSVVLQSVLAVHSIHFDCFSIDPYHLADYSLLPGE